MKLSKERYINLCKNELKEITFDIGCAIINITLGLSLYIIGLILMCSGYMNHDAPLYAVVIFLVIFSAFCGLFAVIIIRLAKLIIKRKELKLKIFAAENDGIISSTLENEYSEDNNGDSLE